MDKTRSKTGSRKTTIVLTAVLLFMVAVLIACVFIYPGAKKYYLAHHIFKIHNGMTEELKDSELFTDMQSGKSFCFLGDSITSGTVTEDIPWYQPLTPYIKGDIYNLSHSGWMVQSLIDHLDEIPSAQVYVIAIGLNDVLFPDSGQAAVTSAEYIDRIGQLAGSLSGSHPDAKIYFIAPWTFTDMGEPYDQRGNQYRSSLAEWCRDKEYVCIDPDPYIVSELNGGKLNRHIYMFNNFHPNLHKGIGLFSYAVLKAASAQK